MRKAVVFMLSILSAACKNEPAPAPAPPTADGPHGDRSKLSSLLKKETPDSIPALELSPEFSKALYLQSKFILDEKISARPAPGITRHDLLETVQKLQAWQHLQPTHLNQFFDFYRVETELKNDKVRITGYYTPEIEASRTRTPVFQVPIYKKPEGDLPAAAAIEQGALEGKGLEIGWLKTKKELKNAQLQGSCVLEFTDGKRKFLGFGGTVREGNTEDSASTSGGGVHVFFKEMGEDVFGAGGFELTHGYSIATDPRHIPMGSCLLAELPVIDTRGKQHGYTYRIVFAQDVGGAIRTTKRIDLYTGVGEAGLKEAATINRYGRLWLLLPK